jgi:hypothetical protein
LWPIAPNLANTYRKRPLWLWRTALFASIAGVALLIVPGSPLRFDNYLEIKEPPVDRVGMFGLAFEDPDARMYLDCVGLPIFYGMLAVAPLMPLVCVSTLHSVWKRRRKAGMRSMTAGPT